MPTLRKQSFDLLDLLVWQRSMQLLKETYERTEKFPRREIYGITAQMRRAAL